MYPTAELNALDRRKAELRQQIAVTRLQCAALAGEVAKPLELIDRIRARWRKISPIAKLAAIPLALLLRRGALRRGMRLGSLASVWRWAPLVVSGLQMLRARRGAG